MDTIEKSVIIGLFEPDTHDHTISDIMEEMKLLTASAGGEVVESFSQKRRPPDARYLIGKGKVEEIKEYVAAEGVNLVIFYNTLSNSQQRNLERFFGIKVIDRTRLILDVFALHARTLEGKLQVQLAQLLYLLPRLTGRGIDMSRLGGGIGTRGPGETKLEADRRTIRKEISIIKHKLDKVLESREVQRKHRKSNPTPVVSLVGYTSAGKSTLFKTLTGEDVTISRMLFSTLDPLMRRVEMSEWGEGFAFLLTDTVGFIRQMPEELFQSFKATLEEMVQADIILHVIDISNPDYMSRRDDVEKVLKELEIPEDKIINVFNKIDLMPRFKDHQDAGKNSEEFKCREDSEEPEETEETEKTEEPEIAESSEETPGEQDTQEAHEIAGAAGIAAAENSAVDLVGESAETSANRVYISAREGIGLDALKNAIYEKYFKNYKCYTLAVPQNIISLDSIKKWAIVLNKRFVDGLLEVNILCSKENMLHFKKKHGEYVKQP